MKSNAFVSAAIVFGMYMHISCVFADEKSGFIAVIEDSQNCEKMGDLNARVLFKDLGGKWVPVSQTDKNIPLEGWIYKNNNDQIVSIRKNNDEYENDSIFKRDKLYSVNRGDISHLQNNADRYAGWCGTPKYKPVILHNQNEPKISTNIKEISNNKDYLKKVFPYFRVSVGLNNMRRCLDINSPKTTHFDITENDVVIDSVVEVNDVYLVSLSINQSKINCDGPLSQEFSKKVFLLRGDKIDYLENQLQFIDAYDHNGDGSLEYLFWYSGYNEDGYVLYYDSFGEHSQYLWKYH